MHFSNSCNPFAIKATNGTSKREQNNVDIKKYTNAQNQVHKKRINIRAQINAFHETTLSA